MKEDKESWKSYTDGCKIPMLPCFFLFYKFYYMGGCTKHTEQTETKLPGTFCIKLVCFSKKQRNRRKAVPLFYPDYCFCTAIQANFD